jgi:hypothetical protein
MEHGDVRRRVVELADLTNRLTAAVATSNTDHGLLEREEAVVRERRVHVQILARASEDTVRKR